MGMENPLNFSFINVFGLQLEMGIAIKISLSWKPKPTLGRIWISYCNTFPFQFLFSIPNGPKGHIWKVHLEHWNMEWGMENSFHFISHSLMHLDDLLEMGIKNHYHGNRNPLL